VDTALPAELTWSGTAIARGATPSFDGESCSGVYYHGATLRIGGGATTAPIWTQVDGTQKTCDACHGLPPPAPHIQIVPTGCDPCHDWTGLAPNDPSTHINGVLDGDFACGACHDVAPTTGAHPAHYGESTQPPRAVYGDLSVTADYEPDGLPVYLFGCGNCHPTDGSQHMNGTVDVELYDENAPAASLKSNQPPTASYDGSTCTDVYCHSSGQATPTYVETPDWHSGTLPEPRCSGCHTNPPSYASGGAGTATANSHVVLAEDGYEYGHFGGLPGAWHSGGGYHGGPGDQASPISCQTCHYDSINPNDTGPGGFYWLNTDGNYDLGGELGYGCDNCHSDTNPDAPLGSGRAWSKAHVNGNRDVVFDPRTSIPSATSGLPAPPNTPTLPYWVTAQPSNPPPDSVLNGSATWSLHVAGASYDPATKTCSNVPCHLNQSFGTGLPDYDPLVWGTVPVGMSTCNACHQF
jgi:predicted CxxxxCH...CXXCH cytochrome family protein